MIFNKVVTWMSSLVVTYPASKRLSYYWNFGSFLGLVYGMQMITGITLVFYSRGTLEEMLRWGFIVRVYHLNGASLFFCLMYLHLGRGLYSGSYRLSKTWIIGVTILLLSILTAFIGYVLLGGQMSFWAATVITNLVSAAPNVGTMIVLWIWGGYNVGGATLSILHLAFFTSNSPPGLHSHAPNLLAWKK